MDPELTREARSLAAIAGGEARELMRRGLDWLARVAPYDLATAFALEGAELAGHGWPGNIREPADLALPGGAGPSRPPVEGSRLASLEEVERAHVARVLQSTKGNIYGMGGAAEILGLEPSTLQSRMKKLGLERRDVA